MLSPCRGQRQTGVMTVKDEEGTVVNQELNIRSWLDISTKFIQGGLDKYGNSMGKVYFVFLQCSAHLFKKRLETEKSVGNGQLIISTADLWTETSIL